MYLPPCHVWYWQHRPLPPNINECANFLGKIVAADAPVGQVEYVPISYVYILSPSPEPFPIPLFPLPPLPSRRDHAPSMQCRRGGGDSLQFVWSGGMVGGGGVGVCEAVGGGVIQRTATHTHTHITHLQTLPHSLTCSRPHSLGTTGRSLRWSSSAPPPPPSPGGPGLTC